MDGHPIVTTWIYIYIGMTHAYVTLYYDIGNNNRPDGKFRVGEDLLLLQHADSGRPARRHGPRIRSENDIQQPVSAIGPLSYGPAGINKPHSLSAFLYIIYVSVCACVSPLTTTTTTYLHSRRRRTVAWTRPSGRTTFSNPPFKRK